MYFLAIFLIACIIARGLFGVMNDVSFFITYKWHNRKSAVKKRRLETKKAIRRALSHAKEWGAELDEIYAKRSVSDER